MGEISMELLRRYMEANAPAIRKHYQAVKEVSKEYPGYTNGDAVRDPEFQRKVKERVEEMMREN